jgi:hypothetical protein
MNEDSDTITNTYSNNSNPSNNSNLWTILIFYILI